MKNLKMASKLGVGFGLLTLLVGVLGYLAFASLMNATRSSEKIADAYIPISDKASNVIDAVRIAQRSIQLYEIFGKNEDRDMVKTQLDVVAKEFASLQKVSEHNKDLTATAAAVQAFPPMFKSFVEGCQNTIKQFESNGVLLQSLLKSSEIAEKAIHDLGEEFAKLQVQTKAAGDMDGYIQRAGNIENLNNIELYFKEMRRIYANARLTYDTGVKKDIENFGAKAMQLVAVVQQSVQAPSAKERSAAMAEAIKAYNADIITLLAGWDKLNSVSAGLRVASTRIGDMMEKLNRAANENAVKFSDATVKENHQAVNTIIIMTLAMTAIGIIFNLFLTRIITKPLHACMHFAKGVAAGNLDDNLSLHSRDEIGNLADALRTMVASLKAKILEANEQSAVAKVKSDEAMMAMEEARKAQAAAENAKHEGMLAAARQLEDVVEVVSSASAQLSAQVEESERGAALTSERITETATAMEEMNATVMEVARSAGSAASVSADAKQKAEEGAVIVDNVVRCIADVEHQSTQLKSDMGQLGQQAEAIGAIMNVISDIADQTNLLALNAAIEAARAGEAGRGFAVVADEVRKLAEKTMQATVEVGNAIRGVQQSAEKNMKGVDASSQIITQATDMVHQAGTALKEIVSLVEDSADQVRTIATAAEQQSSTSDEINRSLGTISSASSDTARAMAEAAQAVSDLSQQAQTLSKLIEDMKRG